MKSIHSQFLQSFVIILYGVVATAGFSYKASASPNIRPDYCADAQTTADIVTCKATEMRAESERLDKLYNAVRNVYKDNDKLLKRLRDNQKNWVAFRNDTCEIEGLRYQGGSLQRVQELSCLAGATSARTGHFESMLEGVDTAQIPQFTTIPRWVNVLGHDYRDVFWAISSKQMVDTDCDSIDEVVIRGLRENANGGYDTIIALVDSEPTGRPVISLLNFDDTKNCEILPEIIVTPVPPVKPNGVVDLKQCKRRASIRTENCGDFVIELDKASDSYTLSTQNN